VARHRLKEKCCSHVAHAAVYMRDRHQYRLQATYRHVDAIEMPFIDTPP